MDKTNSLPKNSTPNKSYNLLYVFIPPVFILLYILGGYLEYIYVSMLIPVAIYYFVRRKNNELAFDYMTVFILFYLFLYIIIPYNYLKFYYNFNHYSNPSYSNITSTSILTITSFIFVVIGYNSYKKNYVVEKIDYNFKNDKEYIIGISFFFLGILSFFLYANIYGGIVSLYSNIDQIRSGYMVGNEYSFLRRFIQYVNFGMWLIVSCILASDRKFLSKTLLISPLVIISIALTFVTGGRLDVFFVLIPVCYGSYFATRRLPPLSLIASLFLVAIIWFSFGDDLFSSLSYKKERINFEKNIYFELIGEFVHPFNSLVASIDNTRNQSDFRGIKDVIYSMQSLLPERLLGIRAESTVTSINTMYLTGKFDSTIPPGIIGYFYYSFGTLGVVIGSFFFGFAMKLMEYFISRKIYYFRAFSFLYVAYAVSIIHYMMSGDPRIYLQTYFWLYSATIFVLFTIYIDSFKNKTEKAY